MTLNRTVALAGIVMLSSFLGGAMSNVTIELLNGYRPSMQSTGWPVMQWNIRYLLVGLAALPIVCSEKLQAWQQLPLMLLTAILVRTIYLWRVVIEWSQSQWYDAMFQHFAFGPVVHGAVMFAICWAATTWLPTAPKA